MHSIACVVVWHKSRVAEGRPLAGSPLVALRSTFTLPLILATARAETSLGGTDWGMLQAGITIAMIPCIGIYLLLQKYYVSGFTQGALK